LPWATWSPALPKPLSSQAPPGGHVDVSAVWQLSEEPSVGDCDVVRLGYALLGQLDTEAVEEVRAASIGEAYRAAGQVTGEPSQVDQAGH
jgi:hypothetical protein